MRRFWTDDRGIVAGLLAVGLLAAVAGIGTARVSSQQILRDDARAIAVQWTTLVMERFRNPGPQTDPGVYVEMISEQLLGAFREQAHPALRSGHADARASEPTDDPGNFHRGRYVSQIYRYVIFGRDGTVFAKSGRFEEFAELDIASPAAGAEAFERATHDGKITIHPLAGEVSRVFVPYRTSETIPYVVAVDIDQYGAATLLDGAMNIVTALTALFMIGGIGIPVYVASRYIRRHLQAQERIRHLALHDALTGLPNRAHLTECLTAALNRTARNGSQLAIYCLDIDHFKLVNDTLGHTAGDALLVEVARRLMEIAPSAESVGRLGGDEFVLIVEEVGSADHAAWVGERICSALSEPYRLEGHEIASSASVGIAVGTHRRQSPDDLLRNADLALYRAKRGGRNAYRLYDSAMEEKLRDRRRLERDLRTALSQGQLHLHYQPQFDLVTGALNGYEALLRWRHPERGLVPPDIFVPLAEEAGMISQIGAWVVRTACRYAAQWDQPVTLAINLSPAQFNDEDIVSVVKQALEETGLPPSRLELEITEGLLLHACEAVFQTLKELRALGLGIAMDDFGAGYSSLSYLTRFPFSKIKIDRSFVRDLGTSDEADAIVKTVVGLGRSLGVTITAEGVELPEQASFLRAIGCDQVQGFLYGRPRESILTAAEQPVCGAAIRAHAVA